MRERGYSLRFMPNLIGLVASFKKPETLVLIAAFIILGFFSIFRLSEAPGIWYDEGYYTQLAMNVAQHGQQRLQITPTESVSAATQTGGFTLIFPVAAAYKLFGIGVVQGRSVMVLYLFALLAATYWLVRLLFGPATAAWSALLMSTFAMLYGDGKPVLGEVPGLFFLLLTLIAIFYLERSGYRHLRAYAATGLAAGLCVVTKPIFLLLLPALFFTLLIRWHRIHLRWSGFVLALVIFLLPVALWIGLQFGAGDSLASMLSFYANPYQVGDVGNLALQNLARFFTEITPLYTFVLLLVWAVSMYVRRRAGRPASTTELSAFMFCMMIIAAYLRLPGWYRYIFPAAAVSLIFLPVASVVVFEYLRKRFSGLERIAFAPYVFFALMSAGQLYQVAFSSYVADYYDGHRTRDLSATLAMLAPEKSILLYNVPEVAVLLHTQNYYQYLKPHETDDGELLGRNNLALLRAGTFDYVIINSSVYQLRLSDFSKYALLGTANRYSVLKNP